MFAYCENNPVCGYDPTGHFAKEYKNLYFDDGVGGGGGGAIVWGFWHLLEQTADALISLASLLTVTTTLRELGPENGEYCVYVLVESDEPHYIQYVGRTKDPKARAAAHAMNPNRADLKLVIIGNNLTYLQVRGLEQVLMLYCHTINKGNLKNNQINGISPSNDNLDDYWKAAEGVLGYAWNQLSNEFLCWLGR